MEYGQDIFLAHVLCFIQHFDPHLFHSLSHIRKGAAEFMVHWWNGLSETTPEICFYLGSLNFGPFS
jgi:hypothetical protein